MATYRSTIDRKRQKYMLTGYIAFGAFALAGFLSTINRVFLPLTLTAFLVFAACSLFLIYGIRCPRCRNAIGYTFVGSGVPFSASKIRYCPYCALDFDSEASPLPRSQSNFSFKRGRADKRRAP